MNRSKAAWVAIRVALALLLAAHGWARLIHGGVAPFGRWLSSQGLPLGAVLAWAVTALEILGTPLLALGKWVTPLSLAYAFVLTVGLVMVHAREGWFVVGPGRNGMEYSVLLLVCLLGLGLQGGKR